MGRHNQRDKISLEQERQKEKELDKLRMELIRKNRPNKPYPKDKPKGKKLF